MFWKEKHALATQHARKLKRDLVTEYEIAPKHLCRRRSIRLLIILIYHVLEINILYITSYIYIETKFHTG